MIIVVSLLALLVLALVSLATLTRIETQVGANSRKQAQARQNARFALEQAISELQRHAGSDTRVTATAEIAGISTANKHWTGVWNASNGDGLTWLISGNENGNLAYQPASAAVTNLSTTSDALSSNVQVGGAPARVLVGPKSTGGAAVENFVAAPLVDLRGPVLGEAVEQTVGRYAWWVGDEGVKASMVLPDRLPGLNYGPYVSDAIRARVRQQVAFGPADFVSTTASHDGFNPASNSNVAAVPNVVNRAQIAYLDPTGTFSLVPILAERYHSWTTVARGVLANTRSGATGGLKRDVSMDPTQLGGAIAAWLDYGSYMEMPGSPMTPQASPSISSSDDVRRRYSIVPPTGVGAGGTPTFSVAPVLSDFIVQFSVRVAGAGGAPGQLEVRARIVAGLWNPYTSALVPEPIRISVGGLPIISVAQGPTSHEIDLQALVGPSLEMNLEFGGTAADQVSMLPGRTYYWRTPAGNPASTTVPLSPQFYAKNFVSRSTDNSTVQGWSFAVSGSPLFDPTQPLTLQATSVTLLTVETRKGGVLLASYQSPTLTSFGPLNQPATSASPSADSNWVFGLGFRLAQPYRLPGSSTVVYPQWLSTPGGDPRSAIITSNSQNTTMAFNPTLSSPLSPASYGGNLYTSTNATASGSPARLGLLLNRSVDVANRSYNNDTPIFELPRSPVLSIAGLQHVQVQGLRPFAIGNSWGAGASPAPSGGYTGGTIGSWFDRFFFSGVPATGPGPDLSLGQPLPFYHLSPWPLWGETAEPDLTALRNAGIFSSKYLMLDGAFNVNSVNPDAWESVLKSLRPAAREDWIRAALDPSTGTVATSPTVADSVEDTTQGTSGTLEARAFGFFRFSQSAQESFQTDATLSGFSRNRFRQGFVGGSSGTGSSSTRNLRTTEIRLIAEAIVARIREVGPITTLEQFVSPVPATSTSILEDAIVTSGVNSDVPDMCAHLLTQADVLTAIGPFLQCRSDTFTIRAYGETVNPLLVPISPDYVEARAWCEATVQRVPSKVDGTDPTTEATGLGRRFVVTSFRWLSPDDI